jgi:hypothetical protein
MARRKDSTLKDIMQIATMFPCWIGICLALGNKGTFPILR